MGFALTICTLGALAATAAGPPEFEILRSTVSAGGVTATGGDFELTGSAGDPGADPALAGGEFTLVGGFVPTDPFTCPADLDGDGAIGITDLNLLLVSFTVDDGGDIDGDGDTDGADLGALLIVYGTDC